MDSIQVSTSPARPAREGRPSRSGLDLEGDNTMTMGHDSVSPASASRPGQSGRKGSKKVRTGCITCKWVRERAPRAPIAPLTSEPGS